MKSSDMVKIIINNEEIEVDSMITELISYLNNEAGIETLYSCAGWHEDFHDNAGYILFKYSPETMNLLNNMVLFLNPQISVDGKVYNVQLLSSISNVVHRNIGREYDLVLRFSILDIDIKKTGHQKLKKIYKILFERILNYFKQ